MRNWKEKSVGEGKKNIKKKYNFDDYYTPLITRTLIWQADRTGRQAGRHVGKGRREEVTEARKLGRARTYTHTHSHTYACTHRYAHHATAAEGATILNFTMTTFLGKFSFLCTLSLTLTLSLSLSICISNKTACSRIYSDFKFRAISGQNILVG